MTKIITAKQLQDLNARRSQVVLFRELFGEQVEVTVALCESMSDQFDFDWAAANLLTDASTREEFKRVCDPASAEYVRVRDSASAEYDRVCDPALAEYDRVRASAWAQFDRACANAFATAYLDQE